MSADAATLDFGSLDHIVSFEHLLQHLCSFQSEATLAEALVFFHAQYESQQIQPVRKKDGDLRKVVCLCEGCCSSPKRWKCFAFDARKQVEFTVITKG